MAKSAGYDLDNNQLDKLIENSIEYQKILLYRLTEEINDRMKDDLLLKFIPLPKQKEFIECNSKIRLYIGGNRSGKTEIGAWEFCALARNEHPYKKLPPNSTLWAVALDFKNMAEGTLKEKVFKYLPDRYIKNFDRKNYMLELWNGHTIYFKSNDSGAEKFQGAMVHVLWLDEEPNIEVWKECKIRTIIPDMAGYDTKGYMIITMTPTNGMSWSKDELYDKADGVRISKFEVNTTDNTFLPPEEVQAQMEAMTEEERAMRINGKYISQGGKKIFDGMKIANYVSHLQEPRYIGYFYNGNFIEDSNGGLKLWEDFDERATYFIGADTSDGMKDRTSIEVIKFFQGRLTQVAEFNKVIEPEAIWRMILSIAEAYNNPLLVIENNKAAATIDRLKYIYKGTIYTQESIDEYSTQISRKLGWHTNAGSKMKMITDFRDIMSNNNITINSLDLLKQMENFIEKKDGKLEAQHGHDDLVMAIMLALEGFLSLQTYIKPESKLAQKAIVHHYTPEQNKRKIWRNM